MVQQMKHLLKIIGSAMFIDAVILIAVGAAATALALVFFVIINIWNQ